MRPPDLQNPFAALSLSGEEEKCIERSGVRAIKKRERAARHRCEQANKDQIAPRLPEDAPLPHAVGGSHRLAGDHGVQDGFDVQPPFHCLPQTGGSCLAISAQGQGACFSGNLDDAQHPDTPFYSLYMTDDHQLVACNEAGHTIMEFEVASPSEAFAPAFQSGVHDIVRSMLLHPQRDQQLHSSMRSDSSRGGGGSTYADSPTRGSMHSVDPQHWSPSTLSMLSSLPSDTSPAPLPLLAGDTPSCWGQVPEGGFDPGQGPRHSSGPGQQDYGSLEWAGGVPDGAAGDDVHKWWVGVGADAAWSEGLGWAGDGSTPVSSCQGFARGGGAGAAGADFPPLPPPQPNNTPPPGSASQQAPGWGLKSKARRGRGGTTQPPGRGQQAPGGGVRVLNRGWEVWEGSAAACSAGGVSRGGDSFKELEAGGLRLHEDDLNLTLLLYDDECVRQAVLASAAQQAQRDDSGAAAFALERAAGGKGGAQQAQRGGAGDVPWDGVEEGGGGGGYCKKSLRKVVEEMKARGWRQVQNAGHQKFEREFPELGGWKQVYFMSCTPSDVRYIHAVRANLARLDRVALERKEEWERLQRLRG